MGENGAEVRRVHAGGLECTADGGGHGAAVRVAGVDARGGRAGARAEDFTVDGRAACLGGIQPFEHECGGAFGDDPAASGLVEGPACRGRVGVACNQAVEEAVPHEDDGADSALAAGGQHQVGVVAVEDAAGLVEGEQAAGVAARQRVARPLGVPEDAGVAGVHVRQVFQQPQGEHLGNAVFAPAGEGEPPVFA